MPINYKLYPINWLSEIRPSILKRANNCCENCRVENYEYVFRGIINRNQPNEKEVYQDNSGRVFDAENGTLLFKSEFADIYPLSGNPNQKAIKIILTIAHLDHDITNNDPHNLKALCQKCHLGHDKEYHKHKRRLNKSLKVKSLF